jgi:hypothetical protein
MVRALRVGERDAPDEILTVLFVRANWESNQQALQRGDTSGGLALAEFLGALVRLANFLSRSRSSMPLSKRMRRFLRKHVSAGAAGADVLVHGAEAQLRDTLDGREMEDLYYGYQAYLRPLFEYYARRAAKLAAKLHTPATRIAGKWYAAPQTIVPSSEVDGDIADGGEGNDGADEPDEGEGQRLWRRAAKGARTGTLPPPLPRPAATVAPARNWDVDSLPSSSEDEEDIARKQLAERRHSHAHGRSVGHGGCFVPETLIFTISADDWLDVWRSAGLLIDAQAKIVLAATSLDPSRWSQLRSNVDRFGGHVPIGLTAAEVQGIFVDSQSGEISQAQVASGLLVDSSMSFDEFWEGIARFAAKLPEYAFDVLRDRLVERTRMPPDMSLSVRLAVRTHLLLQFVLRAWREDERELATKPLPGARESKRALVMAALAKLLDAAPIRASMRLSQYRMQVLVGRQG